MPTNPALTSARNMAYQGAGRNLLQFQRLELLLKHLLACHQVSYTLGTLADEMKRRQKAQERKTLGLLAGDLFEKVIRFSASDDIPPTNGAGPVTISHGFDITIAEEMHQEWQSRLKCLVDERNQLVHLSLLTWDLDTIEGCHAVTAALDEQRGRIVKEFEQLKCYYESYTQCLKQLWEGLKDEDILKDPGISP